MKANPYVYGGDNPVNEIDPRGQAGFLNCLGALIVNISEFSGIELGITGVFLGITTGGGVLGGLIGSIGGPEAAAVGAIIGEAVGGVAGTAVFWLGSAANFVYNYNQIANNCGWQPINA